MAEMADLYVALRKGGGGVTRRLHRVLRDAKARGLTVEVALAAIVLGARCAAQAQNWRLSVLAMTLAEGQAAVKAVYGEELKSWHVPTEPEQGA